jgi:hypothetical protein
MLKPFSIVDYYDTERFELEITTILKGHARPIFARVFSLSRLRSGRFTEHQCIFQCTIAFFSYFHSFCSQFSLRCAPSDTDCNRTYEAPSYPASLMLNRITMD